MAPTPEQARAAALKSHEARRLKKMATMKSGDSARQDAQEAILADRTNVTPDVRELPALLQGAVDEKKEQGASTEALALARAQIEKLTIIVEGLSKQVIDLGKNREVVNLIRPEPLMKCPTCGQVALNPSTKRGVCDGNHRATLVLPKQRDLVAQFQGVTVNGKCYFGMCMLPVAIIDGVLSEISHWETNERAKFIKSGRIFGSEHRAYTSNNTASIGGTPIIG